jgi:hypothetical protein
LLFFGSIFLLRFDDAIHRADILAAGGIIVANALDTGVGIDHIDIALGDGLGGAFGEAGTTSDAVFQNFHCHNSRSLLKFEITFMLIPSRKAHVN